MEPVTPEEGGGGSVVDEVVSLPVQAANASETATTKAVTFKAVARLRNERCSMTTNRPEMRGGLYRVLPLHDRRVSPVG